MYHTVHTCIVSGCGYYSQRDDLNFPRIRLLSDPTVMYPLIASVTPKPTYGAAPVELLSRCFSSSAKSHGGRRVATISRHWVHLDIRGSCRTAGHHRNSESSTQISEVISCGPFPSIHGIMDFFVITSKRDQAESALESCRLHRLRVLGPCRAIQSWDSWPLAAINDDKMCMIPPDEFPAPSSSNETQETPPQRAPQHRRGSIDAVVDILIILMVIIAVLPKHTVNVTDVGQGTVKGHSNNAPAPDQTTTSRRPSLLPAFEPCSSSPALPRPAKRKLDDIIEDRKYYPTPIPTSSTGILPSSPPAAAARRTRPPIQRTVSTLSERAPLGVVPCLHLAANGEPVLMGRSSSSSDYQLAANRHISRVHVRASHNHRRPHTMHLLHGLTPLLLALNIPVSASVDHAHLSAVPGTAVQPLPLLIWHGLGDKFDNPGLADVSDLVQRIHPGTPVHIIRLGETGDADRTATFFGNVSAQIAQVCHDLLHDPVLAPFHHPNTSSLAVNALGFSQGGQFLRGLLQRCEPLRVRTLVTFGSQHNGIAQFQRCTSTWDYVCRAASALLQSNAFSATAQRRVVPAQYFRPYRALTSSSSSSAVADDDDDDDDDDDAYLAHSAFLADVNNERPRKNPRYAARIAALRRFVMFVFADDQTVLPRESGWFADVDASPDAAKRVVTPLRERTLYKEDWLGLRALDERGGLVFREVPGRHMEFREGVLEDTIREFFAPEGKEEEGEGERWQQQQRLVEQEDGYRYGHGV
nr:palmitoyl-protein thioesterase 1 [Quercus suber]